MFPPSKSELDKVNEFSKLMNEMAVVWPGINNKSRYKKYYQYVELMPIHAWREIVDTILDNFRHMPLPKDFQDAATAWKKANNHFSGNEVFEVNINNCDHCFDSGVIFVKVKSSEPTVFMYCDCRFGEQCMSNHSIDLPRWGKSFDAMGFIKESFDAGFFKPQIQGEVTFEKLQTTLDRFRNKLIESKEYFNKLSERQRKGEITI